MDKVFIEGLEIEALIGIYDWERRVHQPLVFDLEMAFDNRRPAASDAIADTLDYKAVSKRLIEFVSQSDFGLVETLAERCAAIVLDEFDVRQVRLKLSKPGAVRGARAVGVIIERGQDAERRIEAGGNAGALDEADGHQDSTQAVPSPAPVEASPVTPVSIAAAAFTPAPAPATVTTGAAAGAAAGSTTTPAIARKPKPAPNGCRPGTARAYLSLGSNVEPERNLRAALVALRARFGQVRVSPVYRTPSVGFAGPDFLNAIAVLDSDIHPFALSDWLHALEVAQGRDRRDASYSNRPLDLDIIYFGDVILDGPGELQLPRPELRHAFVLKPLADIAPDYVDPIRGATLAQLWAAHPQHDSPPQCVALDL